MNNLNEKLLEMVSDKHMHITVLDDGETFSGIEDAFVILNATNNGGEFGIDEFSQKYAVADLIAAYISSQSQSKKSLMNMSTISSEFEEILNMWNDLIQEVFSDWQTRMINEDPMCPDSDDPDHDDYVEERYSYEMFCETSEENKAFIYITQMGI